MDGTANNNQEIGTEELTKEMVEIFGRYLSVQHPALATITPKDLQPILSLRGELQSALINLGSVKDPLADIDKGLAQFCFKAASHESYKRSLKQIVNSVRGNFTYATPMGDIEDAIESVVSQNNILRDLFEDMRRRAGIGFTEEELLAHLEQLSRKALVKGLKLLWMTPESRRPFWDFQWGKANLLEALTHEIYAHACGWSERRDRKLISRLDLIGFSDRVSPEISGY